MNAQQLKNSILQEAIEGRLVPPACRQAGKILTMNQLPPFTGKRVWYTYVIECEDGSFYKGFTDNLIRRYKQHCDGIGAEHTKKHPPKQLYYWEMYYSQEEAIAREKYLKSGVGREWFKREVVDKPENWEPASVLLQRIREEKKRLVKEGKLKKKDLEEKPISEDEIPFEIPESWEWCRLINVVNDIADIDHKMPPVSENGIPYISPLNFRKDGSIDYENAKKISEEDFVQLSKKCKPERGDLIFPRYGTIGVLRKVETDIDFLVSYSCATIKPHLKNIYSDYILCVLNSPLIQNVEIKRYINKTTQPNIGLQSIKQFLFPLPPLAEQQRIVAKIEELMPKVEKYGKAQEALNKLNEELPEKLKKSILQEAIEGRLVPQDPNDEPASVLLQRIREEKKRLVKEGKLKKKDLEEKPISEDEIPFEIPESWEWCKIEDITISVGNKNNQIQSKEILNEGMIPVVSQGQKLIDGYSNEIDKTINELPLIMFGDHTRNVKLIDFPFVIGADGTKFFKPIKCDEKYIYYIVLHIASKLRNRGYARHYTLLRNEVFPLPPLAEQRRIVEKIEQVLGEIDKLKA